jgi:hypothetical protein
MRSSSRWSPTTFTWTGPYEARGLRVSPAAQLGAAADHSLRSWRLSARVGGRRMSRGSKFDRTIAGKLKRAKGPLRSITG